MREIILDVSELEAPQPIIEARKAIQTLQEGEVLVFHHRMKPFPLLRELEQRGIKFEIMIEKPNKFTMKVYK